MAVQPWDLTPGTTTDRVPQRRPSLELVPAPPRGGRVLPALVFVAILVGAIGAPSIRSAIEGPVAPRSWAHRALPASQVSWLDPLSATTGGRPTSGEPAAGLLFVRCTNLWTAEPDGSHARKLLELPGISTATFSPDARTIAFVGPGAGGPALYMVGADGSGLVQVGPLTRDGSPIEAQVTNLAWSETGKRLAFALRDPLYDPWNGGSTIWTYELDDGTFRRVGDGWPAPSFAGLGVVFSEWISTKNDVGPSFVSPNGYGRYVGRRLSTAADDLTFGAIPQTFSDSWASDIGVLILRRDRDGELELVARSEPWRRRAAGRYTPPTGHSFFAEGRVSISQDGRSAVIDLIDRRGERDLGVLDLRTGDWSVLDYAWSGSASPAPTSSGPLGARRASRLTSDILGTWGRDREYSAAAIMVADRAEDLMWRRLRGHVAGVPVRTEAGWAVPATLYARDSGGFVYQRAIVDVRRTQGRRLEAVVDATSGERRIRTVVDAKRFIQEVIGEEIAFKWPAYLPAGARLDKRAPVDAYAWDGELTASVRFLLPAADLGSRRSYTRSLTVAFGDVNFGLGCGGEVDPYEDVIGEGPALFDELGRKDFDTRQVLWPATLRRPGEGIYSIYGELPPEELKALAESMAGS